MRGAVQFTVVVIAITCYSYQKQILTLKQLTKQFC